MFKTISSALFLLLIAAVSTLAFFLYQTHSRLTLLENEPQSAKPFSVSVNPTPAPEGSEAADQYTTAAQLTTEISDLKAYVDQSLANLSTTSTQTTATPTPAKQTSFISLGDTYSTTSTAWVDVPGSEVYIDIGNDYSISAYITWSASLKVAHANGQAFARLYDDTNKIAVAGSELSTINNATYTKKTSPQLAFWRGNNLYKIQIKSLNSFEVTVSGGKIKITY